MIDLILLLIIVWAVSSIVCASEMDNPYYKGCHPVVAIFIAICPIINTLHIFRSVRKRKKIDFMRDFKEYF